MHNKEIMALLREVESRNNLADALKSGEAAKKLHEETWALEKSVGGAKRIAEAENILGAANVERLEIIAAGKTVVDDMLHIAEEQISAGKDALDERERVSTAAQISNSQMRESLAVKSQELEDANLALQAREDEAVDRDTGFEQRESKVYYRERNATAREADIKRYDDWRLLAP